MTIEKIGRNIESYNPKPFTKRLERVEHFAIKNPPPQGNPLGKGNKPMVTSPMGPRYGTLHRGIDLSTGGSAKLIYPPSAGIVQEIGFEPKGGYYMTINHGNGWCTKYLHLTSFDVYQPAMVGSSVHPDRAMAKSGNTGSKSSGYHLHYEVIRTPPGKYRVGRSSLPLSAWVDPRATLVPGWYNKPTITTLARTQFVIQKQSYKPPINPREVEIRSIDFMDEFDDRDQDSMEIIPVQPFEPNPQQTSKPTKTFDHSSELQKQSKPKKTFSF